MQPQFVSQYVEVVTTAPVAVQPGVRVRRVPIMATVAFWGVGKGSDVVEDVF